MASKGDLTSGGEQVAAPERQYPGGPAQPSQDDVFEVLSNERRRYVLRALRDEADVGVTTTRERGIELGPLSKQVAAWENDTPVADVTYEQRKRVYTALQQSHLPKMDEAGAILFDKNRGVIVPSEEISGFDVYLEIVPGSEIPRSEYYIALSAVVAAVGVVATLDVFPFGLVSDLVWATLFVVAFGISALAHLHAVRTSSPWNDEGDPT